MLHQLAYKSLATAEVNNAEVGRIVSRAQRRNHQLGVTGFLVYRGGAFWQVLEGDQRLLSEVFCDIVRDPRHHSLVLLGFRAVTRRDFRNWSMGVRLLDGEAGGEVSIAMIRSLAEEKEREQASPPSKRSAKVDLA